MHQIPKIASVRNIVSALALCISIFATDDRPATAQEKDNGPFRIDPALPDYAPAGKLSGRRKSVGSDTMNNVMTLWHEEFQKLHPDVQIEIVGKGSTTAPPALLDGSADLATMTRQFKGPELRKFEVKCGYKPTYLVVSFDMLGIMVHKDNPIPSLTLVQLDAIYSKTRRRGHPDIKTWGDLGLKGEWADKKISIYGRNSASGTYGHFKEAVLQNGDFKDNVKEGKGVQGVASDKGGIGYAGIGYATAQLRVVPLVPLKGNLPIPPRAEFAYNGQYPLARPTYIVLNHKPGTDLEPVRKEFIKFIFSIQGQTEVPKCNLVPVNAKIAHEQLEKVGLAERK